METEQHMEFEPITITDGVELKMYEGRHAFKTLGKKQLRWHPLLPAGDFVSPTTGLPIKVTETDLQNMEKVFKSGAIGKRRHITLAHPKNGKHEAEEKAVGWMFSATAEVRPYQNTKAIYIGVEWLPEYEDAIRKKEYAFLSPVFYRNWKNHNTGEDLGPTIRFAGLTNDPHWVDQPELWEAFTAGLSRQETKTEESTKGTTQQEDEEMSKELQAKIDDLQGQVEKFTAESGDKDKAIDRLQKEIKELQGKLTVKTEEAVAFTAAHDETKSQVKELKDEVERFKANEKKAVGDALIKKYSSKEGGYRLLGTKLEDDEKKPTAFAAMAYDKPEEFEAIVSNWPERTVNEDPKGSEFSAPNTSDEAMIEKAEKMCADAEAKGDTLSFPVALKQAEEEMKKEQQ